MVATVGSISIDLSTNAAKFASGFKQSATTVEQQSGRMSKALKSVDRNVGILASGLKGFAAGAIAGLGLNSITAGIDRAREAVSRFDEIATNASKVGLPTDTFQALGFAAKQANVEQETFNKSMEIFAKNVGLAENGAGSLYTGLSKLNPELLKNILNASNQEDRLKAVADALNSTSDATQRAAISTAVFGKAGVAIGKIFEGGAASINHLKQVAADLGIIVPDDLLKKAGELDDKLDALSTVITTKLDIALVNIAPALDAAARALIAFVDASAGGATKIAGNVKVMDDALNKLQFGRGNAPSNSGALIDFLLGPQGGGGVSGYFRDLIAGADDSREHIASVGSELKRVQQEISDAEIALADLTENNAYELDIELARSRLEELRGEAASLQGELSNIKVDIDTSEAKARLADLAQQFRESEIASMQALDALHPKPTVHGSNLSKRPGVTSGTVTVPGIDGSPGGDIHITKFGSDDKQILKDIADQVDDGSNDTTDAVDKNTSTLGADLSIVDRSMQESLRGAADDIVRCIRQLGSSVGYGRFLGEHVKTDTSGSDLTSALGDLTNGVQTNTEQLRQLREKGVYFDYSSIAAAVHTGIVTGMDDSLAGKRFAIQTGADPLGVFGGGVPTLQKPDELQQQLDQLRQQADNVGAIAADAFAAKISALESQILANQQKQVEQQTLFNNFNRIAGRVAYVGAFAEGGSFTAGGNQTGDSTRLMMDVNAGERVTVGNGERPIILNYHAAPGESEATSRQNARRMLEIMQREQARA